MQSGSRSARVSIRGRRTLPSLPAPSVTCFRSCCPKFSRAPGDPAVSQPRKEQGRGEPSLGAQSGKSRSRSCGQAGSDRCDEGRRRPRPDKPERVWAREGGGRRFLLRQHSRRPQPRFRPRGTQDSSSSGSPAPRPGLRLRSRRSGSRRGSPGRGFLPAHAGAVAGWAHAHPPAPP